MARVWFLIALVPDLCKLFTFDRLHPLHCYILDELTSRLFTFRSLVHPGEIVTHVAVLPRTVTLHGFLVIFMCIRLKLFFAIQF